MGIATCERILWVTEYVSDSPSIGANTIVSKHIKKTLLAKIFPFMRDVKFTRYLRLNHLGLGLRWCDTQLPANLSTKFGLNTGWIVWN